MQMLSLIMTPSITADQSIIMQIEVARTPDGTVPTPTGSPAIAKNVSNKTLVKDSQTLVLGGIYAVEEPAPGPGSVPAPDPRDRAACSSSRSPTPRKELLYVFVARAVVPLEIAADDTRADHRNPVRFRTRA